jgi:hypothetical protein
MERPRRSVQTLQCLIREHVNYENYNETRKVYSCLGYTDFLKILTIFWLHWASMSSTPHRTSSSEEQALPAAFLAVTPTADFNYKLPGHRNQPPTSNIRCQPTSTTSHPVIAINSRPVTSRAPAQASHNASVVFTVRVNKSADEHYNCGILDVGDRVYWCRLYKIHNTNNS